MKRYGVVRNLIAWLQQWFEFCDYLFPHLYIRMVMSSRFADTLREHRPNQLVNEFHARIDGRRPIIYNGCSFSRAAETLPANVKKPILDMSPLGDTIADHQVELVTECLPRTGWSVRLCRDQKMTTATAMRKPSGVPRKRCAARSRARPDHRRKWWARLADRRPSASARSSPF
jgi:hypothetical protein